jgi:hypothetical protein
MMEGIGKDRLKKSLVKNSNAGAWIRQKEEKAFQEKNKNWSFVV